MTVWRRYLFATAAEYTHLAVLALFALIKIACISGELFGGDKKTLAFFATAVQT
jgi:hypothetical protein